jgi:hypothetical protein
MEYIKPYESLVGPLLTLLLMVIVVPYLRRLYRLHREQGLMIRKKLLEHTGVVIFGVFDGKLQSDYLGGFLTAMFGETLFDLIVGWNEQPSPSVIVPKTDYQREHLQEILAAHASPFVLQSGRIDCYFRGAEDCGTPSYPFARFVVALARPDATHLSSHDYPRVMIVEIGALKRILEEVVTPQYDSKDGRTWLKTLRELGRAFFDGKREGTVILEVPIASSRDYVAPVRASSPRGIRGEAVGSLQGS